MKKEAGYKALVALCLGDFARAIFNGLTVTYLMYIYIPQDGSSLPILLPNAAIAFAIIRGIGVIFDALIDPFIATRSDNSKHRLGARIPFMRFSAIPWAIFGVLIIFVPRRCTYYCDNSCRYNCGCFSVLFLLQ